MQNISINWDQLKIVLTIARAGNLSKAAQRLGVNQTTVGRQLNSLEQQLGVVLFFRSKISMEPTEHGKALVVEAEVMESAVHNALAQVAQTKTEPMGLIRFVTMPWICSHVIAANLMKFSRRHPLIEIQAISGLRERFLDRGEVEIALRFEMQPRSHVASIPVTTVSYSIYAPSGVDVENIPWLGFREEDMNLAPERWLQEISVEESIAFWANDAGILYHGVRNGLGKSLLPDALAAGDPKLTRMSGPKPEMERTLHIQVLPDVQRLNRVSIFIEWLSETLVTVFKQEFGAIPSQTIFDKAPPGPLN